MNHPVLCSPNKTVESTTRLGGAVHSKTTGSEKQRAQPDATPDERELEVLAHVHDVQSEPEEAEKSISQRSIAHTLGMSQGLTNAILKRLSDKGFLK